MSGDIKILRDEVNVLNHKLESLKEEHHKLMNNYAPRMILAELEKEMTKIDSQCDELRRKFKEKEINDVQFSKAFTELRYSYHILGTKKEKFAQFYGN